MKAFLQRFIEEAARLGVNVVSVDFDGDVYPDALPKFPSVHWAPFTSGIGIGTDKDGKHSLLRLYGQEDEDDYLGLIHELGHVCVHGGDVTGSRAEYDFFGWEFVVAQRLGVVEEWVRSRACYGVENGSDFGALTLEEQSEVLEERVAYGESIGIIVEGVPVRP